MLKALESNRRTVSQLAELLKIDKAGVHRHLKKLEEGGFVSRTEDHGFVYYALTWKSRDILNPNDKTKIIILISSSLVCLLAMAIVVYLASAGIGLGTVGGPAEYQSDQQGDQTAGPNGPAGSTTAPARGPDLTAPLVTLGLLAAVLLCSAYLVWKVPRQRGGEEGAPDLGGGAPLIEDD
jgi:DNA-binding transcriptional ArsR family regulator